MALRHLCLGLLVDKPDHAYALKHRLSPGVPREGLINDGVLYPVLAKLETDGLAKSAERASPGGRTRRVYSVTPGGRAEFRRWLRSDEDEGDPPLYDLFVSHPLAKLLFADHLTPAELRAKLEHHADQLTARLTVLESLEGEERLDPAGLAPSLLDLELRQLRERLDWVGGLLQRSR
jgi:PadR family transcriptional regulator, regulatory protein AphA